MSKKIAVLVGSLRKGSFSKQIAKNLMKEFPEGYDSEIIEIGNLPLYNEDIDTEDSVPAEYTTFRNKMKEFDAVLFVTPEYNRSVPANLKNAIDVGSRPYGQSIWDRKPAAVVSVSPGAISGFGANHHLRQSLVFLNMPVVQQPEAYIGNVTNLLDDNGNVDDRTLGFLKSIDDALVDLINRFDD
ncbi:NADPH-dependent FMN reductase [Companilactobacillus sp.]|jgi:chromate reductase|uniref:NADPH-dependent FMN reductase n=1 Tax=Companilactobacillus sp. TaxID=2767905 RepID=UPI0025BA871B|nr:NAD(P)H-dependent oxidoreductase [Companilactobacillus sp.]MCH4008675.1 NAD(P)H-dependent oxidoreductase [Companilactobacillus sp.]MCH4051146.1 NAD(P)H-dependent oxidoreductase [Companilactobacillus sp.]MCH4076618.1 NAD(P)H-dependent oxidoreductase [Companilactobacillus sp.]MCH4125193.1 NAD(P)H-dependent oxidoreductase [Companilactobacillus sp.]MCH4131733.1 NAD(P)H-dependent oxidoreductase [Companilactobacillus sp.]